MAMTSQLDQADHGASRVRKRRSTTFKACVRCHRRKQRCTGYPVCSNCQTVNATCSRDSTVAMRTLGGLSKEELLDRIDQLEARLPSNTNTQILDNTLDRHTDYEQPSLLTLGSQDHDTIDTCSASMDELPTLQQHSPEPLPDLGSNSITLSRLEDNIGDLILNTYLESMHKRVPFFNFAEVASLHRRRHGQIPNNRVQKFLAFKLNMVYAIAAMILKLTKVDLDTQPEDYAKFAIQFKDSVENISLVEKIEATLFMVLYRLRRSLDSDSWYEIGHAMRMCIEGGLHREAHYCDLRPSVAEWRRRLFWGVYIMERNICFSLKRPMSIAEHDIDAELPPPSGMIISPSADPTMTEETDENTPLQPDLSTFAAMLQLVRIKAHMHTTVYRVDKPISCARKKLVPLLQQVRDFESIIPQFTSADQDFLRLHSSNSVRTLIEPFLTTMDSNDELMTICVQAAGQVCQLFKKLRLRKTLGYSFTMVNSVFVAGMTICYILFKNPILWTPGLANDLRACSSILFVIAERNATLRKYCDALEAIINDVMAHLEQTTTPSPSSAPNQTHPIAFHKLKDTFRQLDFELPSEAYPDYTTDPEKRSECADVNHREAITALNPSRGMGGSGIGVELNMGDVFIGSDIVPFEHTLWSIGSRCAELDGQIPVGLYPHEPYTQQMMEELLSQNYFPT